MKQSQSSQVMKKIFSILSALTVLSTATVAPHVYAKSKASEEQVEVKAVHAALENLEPLAGKFNKKADYYIYLNSASWCGACVVLMPEVVKIHKKLKSKKIELILVSFDKSDAEAIAYVEKYKAKFPMVMSSAASQLPGYTGGDGSLTHACFVDADGNLFKNGSGRIILDWKDIIADYKKEQVKAKRAAEREARNAAKS